MAKSNDFWEGMGRILTIWDIVILLSGGGGGVSVYFLRSLPPIIPISFAIVSGLLIVWGIFRTFTNYHRWKVVHNQKYPELDNVINTLWEMHLKLGEVIQPIYKTRMQQKLITKVSLKFSKTLGIPIKNGLPDLKLNVITYARLLVLLGYVYRINPKKVLTLTNVSCEIGQIMDKEKHGLSPFLKEKEYLILNKQYDSQTLSLDINPETSFFIDQTRDLSYGLYSMQVVGNNILRFEKIKAWAGDWGVNYIEQFLHGSDKLYKASLFEVKKMVIKDLSEG